MPNAFERREDPAPIADVNVVPLADVSLVLLIILLVLSPMAAQSMIEVRAAAAKAEAPAGPKPGEDPLMPKAPEPAIVVELVPLGYSWDGRLYPTDADLRAALTPVLARREDRKVYLSPYPDAPAWRVVAAIEAMRSCGASGSALVQSDDSPATAEAR